MTIRTFFVSFSAGVLVAGGIFYLLDSQANEYGHTIRQRIARLKNNYNLERFSDDEKMVQQVKDIKNEWKTFFETSVFQINDGIYSQIKSIKYNWNEKVVNLAESINKVL
jgi:phosphoribosylpyrophosphate synthetase